MRRGSWVRRARHWVANRGWGGFLREVVRRGRLRAGGRQATVEESGEKADEVHPFDREYGVETGGLIWGEQLAEGAGEEDAAFWATGYYGVSPSVFRQAMDRLELEWEQYTFVDVGCGKGRALMLALGYPFRQAVGVELSAELAAVARRNLGRFRPAWRQPAPVEVVTADVTAWRLPAGPLVVYLYHPFAAPVMRRFLEQMRASLEAEPREMVLLYTNPELDGLLRETAWLGRMWDECFGMTEEDIAADRFGSRWERMVAYQARR